MSEITSGVRSVLARPGVYELWSRLVGGEHGRTALLEQYARPQPDERILDLGCGPGELLAYLPHGVDYLGVDLSADYIARARERHGDRAQFEVGDATKFDLAGRARFGLVLAFGVVHHLDDRQAQGLFEGAGRALSSGGRLVTVDPVFAEGQSRLAQAIIERDRGQHVRDEEGYASIARAAFENVAVTIRHDLLRIPYSHCVLECTVALGASER
jgi:SAM-dependent methyltransferase